MIERSIAENPIQTHSAQGDDEQEPQTVQLAHVTVLKMFCKGTLWDSIINIIHTLFNTLPEHTFGFI